MREIKFRAWDTFNKRFTKQFYVSADGKPYTYWDDPLPNALDIVLMQYTGLKDKNGREIYEGDILRDFNGRIVGRVAYDDQHNFGAWVVKDEGGYTLYTMAQLIQRGWFEVIGNVHENPELLKV